MDRKPGQACDRMDAGSWQYVFVPLQRSSNPSFRPSNASSGNNTLGGRYSDSATNSGDSRQLSEQSGNRSFHPSNGSFGSNTFRGRSSKSANNSGDGRQPSQPSHSSHQINNFGIDMSGSGKQHGAAYGRSQQAYGEAQGNVFGAGGQNHAKYFGGAASSSQSAYYPAQANVFGSGSQNSFGQAGSSFMPAQHASQQSQPASSNGKGRQPTKSVPSKDDIPFPVFEAVAKLHQNRIVDLATQLAEVKLKNERMRAKLARQAEREAAIRTPPQQVQTLKTRMYGIKLYEDGDCGRLVKGYMYETSLASLLQEYAQGTGQDMNDLELFHEGKMVNLSLKMGEIRGVWKFEVRKVRR